MDVYEILAAVVSIVFFVIGYFVIPYIKEKTDSVKLNKWKEWAKTAVNCAEMVLETGKSKKEWATNFLNTLINKNNNILSEDQISTLIEAAVMELKIAENLR